MTTKDSDGKPAEKGEFIVRPSSVKPWLIMLVGVLGVGGSSIGIQHLIPALTPDKEVQQSQVDSAVRDLLDHTILEAKEEITTTLHKRISSTKNELREAIKDRLGAVKEAVTGLKELTMVRMESMCKDTKAVQKDVDALQVKLRRLEKAVQSLEEELEAGIEIPYPPRNFLVPEDLDQ